MLKRLLLTTVLGGVALYVVGSALAKKGGGKPAGNLPARITFHDSYANELGEFDSAVVSDRLGLLWGEEAPDDYTNGTGRNKIQVEIVLGGHLDFNTYGSAKADKDGDGRTLFAYFGAPIELETLPFVVSNTIPGAGGLPFGTITEARMTVGSFRFGDEPDGIANDYEGSPNPQAYEHEFDLRSMYLGENRRDVNVGIVLFLMTPEGDTNLRLIFNPAGVGRSVPGSDFATVECIAVDPVSGYATAWDVYPECQYCDENGTPLPEEIYPSLAAVFEGGGGDVFHNYQQFPFKATLTLLQ